MDGYFLQRKNWQPNWRGILPAWRNLIFEMGSRHCNIAGPNALVYRGTMLKNKSSFTEIKHFFLVHSKNLSNHPCIKPHFSWDIQKLDGANWTKNNFYVFGQSLCQKPWPWPFLGDHTSCISEDNIKNNLLYSLKWRMLEKARSLWSFQSCMLAVDA